MTHLYLSRLLNMFSMTDLSVGDHGNPSRNCNQPSTQQPILCQPFASARRSLGNGLVELRHGANAEHASRWLQVSHTFQPSVPRLDVQLEQTTVSLAFNLEGEAPMQQQVYAFLPLRSYGLSFIVQVSSRIGRNLSCSSNETLSMSAASLRCTTLLCCFCACF